MGPRTLCLRFHFFCVQKNNLELDQMQVESNLSKTIITGIKETCTSLGVGSQMLPWRWGGAGARLHSSTLGMQ